MLEAEPTIETRRRLLEAACAVFAEHGFRGATVRDICTRAGANVAAVNYHFRDKEGLYAAVLQQLFSTALEKYPPLLDVAPDAPPERRLHAFVRSFLLRLLDQGRESWLGKLMAREISDPTAALDLMVSESVRPLSMMLAGIVRELLGERATDERVRRCVFSVVGQCLFYHFAAPVIRRLHPAVPATYGPADIDQVAEHVAAFSLAAVRGLAAGVGEDKPTRER